MSKDKWIAELTKMVKMNGIKDGLGDNGVFDFAWRITKNVERALNDGKNWVEVSDIIYNAVKFGRFPGDLNSK